MATWSQTFSVNNKYSLTLTVTEQSTDIANNTSSVSYSLVMATAANSFTGYADYRTQISVSLNGSAVYTYDASRNFNASAASSYSETLCSGTKTISHNADGTKTMACAASVSVASGPYSPGSASISQNLTLTTIPRASTCSWSGDFVIGTAKTITITRASSSFTHKLTMVLGSKTVTPTSSATTSYSWTPLATDWSGQFPTQTSRTGTITLYTYNGSTLIGSNAYTFTLKIPDSWKPSVSVTLSPSTTNAFISGTGLYVAGYSKISAAITGTAATGAAISSYTISGAFSKTVTTSSSSTTQVSGVIATSGSKTVSVTITDARGRTGSASASCTYTAYAYPAVSALSYARGSYVGGVWTTSAAGTDLRITFTGSCSLSGNSNVMSWSIGSPVSTTGSGLTSGSSITRYKTGIGTTTAYSVTVTLTDSVGNSTSRSITVPTVEIPFVIDPTLPAIGVGAVPQTARTLELASNWKINTGGGEFTPNTKDVLTDALSQPLYTTKVYSGSGSSYTGTLPDGNFRYGTFIVNRRGTSSIAVIAIAESVTVGLALNTVSSGNTWNGWRRLYALGATTKTASFNFSAGTIGTRGGQVVWNSSDIGGIPIFTQITNISDSSVINPLTFIYNNSVYVNAYRCTSGGVIQTVDVTIYYT